MKQTELFNGNRNTEEKQSKTAEQIKQQTTQTKTSENGKGNTRRRETDHF